jgi:hypothetical protein
MPPGAGPSSRCGWKGGRADRREAARRIAPYFGGGHLGVEQPRDLARDESRRMGPDPRLQVPVVEGTGHGERQLRIADAQLQPVAAESRHRRGEIDRGIDPVEVHVAHAGVHIPRAAAHLLESHRLVRAFLDRPSGHRGQTDLRVDLAVEQPRLPAPGIFDHPRGGVRKFPGQSPLEHLGRLDQMIVGRNEHQVTRGPGRVRQQGDVVRLLAPHETGAVFHVVQRDACHRT